MITPEKMLEGRAKPSCRGREPTLLEAPPRSFFLAHLDFFPSHLQASSFRQLAGNHEPKTTEPYIMFFERMALT